MAAAALPIIASIGSSLLSGLTGGANTRPGALNPTQSSSLDSLLHSLMMSLGQTPQIDPTQQKLLYGDIAQNQTGANDAVTNALVSRGLGHSGILGNALTQVANEAQKGRNQADLGLQQQAIQQRQLSIQDILGLLNVGTTPGQSTGGGFLAGMAPILAYSIQNMMNMRGSGSGASGGGGMAPYNPNPDPNSLGT